MKKNSNLYNITKIIVTIDYEIFGNGTGDVRDNIIKSTNELLHLFNKYKYPLTIMAETVEIFKFKEYDNELYEDLGYSPFNLIKEQLINAIQTGNDVQLHIHPQWLGAKYNKNWGLNLSKWRTGKLSYKELYNLINKSKSFLEKTLTDYNKDYICTSFRAGNLCIQPEEKVIQCLIDNNIQIDTSVAKGTKENTDLAYYNFTNMPDENYWRVKKDLRQINNNGIYEVPITTVKYNFIQKVFYFLLRKFRKKDYIQNEVYSCKKVKRKIKDLFSNEFFKLDIDYMHIDELKKNILKLSNSKKNKYIVLSGHTKRFNSINSTENLLQFIKGNNNLDICKFDDILK